MAAKHSQTGQHSSALLRQGLDRSLERAMANHGHLQVHPHQDEELLPHNVRIARYAVALHREINPQSESGHDGGHDDAMQ